MKYQSRGIINVEVDFNNPKIIIIPTFSKNILPIFLTFNTAICEVIQMFLSAGQTVNAFINPVDAFGNPAKVESVEWFSSDTSIVEVHADESGLKCDIVSLGHIGNVQISVKADADLGEGIAPLLGTLDIEIVAGQAISLQINVTQSTT